MVYSTVGSKGESEELPMELKTFEVPCPNCGESSFNILFKPRTTHRLICPRCKTPFYVHVKKDLGIIVLREDEYKKAKCPECQRTGVCKKCNGTGEADCPRCGGGGWYYYDDHFYSCIYCGGDGKRHYRYFCDFAKMIGEGRIRRGRGKVKCYNCMGSGVCPRCGGEGLILGEE